MSLLINNMEMPENCLECMFRINYWKRALTPSGKIFTYGCMLNGKEINILEKRCKDCPIDEIPTPHGRLIDADRLLESIKTNFYEHFGNYDSGQEFLFDLICSSIEDSLTIIEAEESK